MIGRSAAAALATAALLLACQACGAAQPLASTMVNGTIFCTEAPNPSPSAETPTWNSPEGYRLNWYQNTSSAPVEVESVALISPHNLILHRAIVQQGTPGEGTVDSGWKLMANGIPSAYWTHRQSVPGAVIPPQTSRNTSSPHEPGYAIVLDISEKTPAGGYALGQKVTYKQGDNQYTFRSYIGYGLAPQMQKCDAFTQAIEAGWRPVSASWQHGS